MTPKQEATLLREQAAARDKGQMSIAAEPHYAAFILDSRTAEEHRTEFFTDKEVVIALLLAAAAFEAGDWP